MLLAVMERGAERFVAELPDLDDGSARSSEHLRALVETVAATSPAIRTSSASSS